MEIREYVDPGGMKTNSVSYEAGRRNDLANPKEAAAYLNAALEDSSQQVFLMALRDVAEARGIFVTPGTCPA